MRMPEEPFVLVISSVLTFSLKMLIAPLGNFSRALLLTFLGLLCQNNPHATATWQALLPLRVKTTQLNLIRHIVQNCTLTQGGVIARSRLELCCKMAVFLGGCWTFYNP